MGTQVFAVASTTETGPSIWNASGSAYEDVRLGDMLADTPTGIARLRVIAISSYGEPTDLLSKTMAGTLQLDGPLPVPSLAGLYRQL
jgi:hypothetical protein